jgi:hypothetical protein
MVWMRAFEIKATNQVKSTALSYVIEQKPDGGFIARPNDPAMEPLEGETKEEVQRKILAGLMPVSVQGTPASSLCYVMERKPDGGFLARPIDSARETLEGKSEEELQRKVLAMVTADLIQKVPSSAIGPIQLKKLNSRTRISWTISAKATPGVETPTGFEGSRSMAGGPSTIQFERNRIPWPAIPALVGVGVILYFLLR